MIDKNNNIIKSKNKIDSNPLAEAGTLLNHIHSLFGHGIKPLMIAYFKSVDDLLLEMAEKSDSHSKQKLYFESLQSIKVHKFNVLSSFLSSIKRTFSLFEAVNFDYFEDKVTKVIKNKNSNTTPFDKNDVNEKLAQNTLIHKTEVTYFEELSALEKRFSYLLGTTLGPYHIPVGPYVLVSSFAKSIRLLHLDLDIKLILYKQFEQSIIDHAGDYYQEINQYLISNNIVAELDKNNVSEQLVIESVPGNDDSESAQSFSESSKKSSDVADNTTIMDKDFILDVLTALQQKINKGLSKEKIITVSPIEIKNTLIFQLKESQVRGNVSYLGQYDKDTINLMTMTFQLIVGDKNIPVPIQYILAKLQIPFIKAAIFDAKLLTNKQHPAQILLDMILSTSVGWRADLDDGEKFIKNVAKTVNAILKESDLNKVFFKNLLLKYKNFIKQQKNDFEKEQTRIKEKLRGRQRIAAAMKTSEAVLAHKMEAVSMPVLIKDMLLGPWKNLLILLLVRDSNTSEIYLRMEKFIDDLIKIIKSKQFEIVIRTNIDKLCLEYEDGLKLVAYNGKELSSKKKELKQCLLKIHKLEGKKGKVSLLLEKVSLDQVKTKIHAKFSAQDPSVFKEDSGAVANLEGLNKKDKELIAVITVGVWVEFTRTNNKPVKAQLSWTSPKTGKYLFVNSRGLKVIDKTPKQLLSGLKDKSIYLIK